MRMIKVALVFLVLAAFLGGTMAVAGAATASPTVISSPLKTPTKIASAMPSKIATPSKMASPTKIAKSGMFQNLNGKQASEANALASNAVKNKAAQMTNSIMSTIAQNSGKSSAKLSTPGMSSMRQLSQLGQMPVLSGNTAKKLAAPGTDLLIGLLP